MSRTEMTSMGLKTGGCSTIVSKAVEPAFVSDQLKKELSVVLMIGVLMLLSAGQALATDLKPSDELLVNDDQFRWSGVYIGGSAGYGWGHSKTTYDRNDGAHETAESSSLTGFAPSLTMGFNYRYNNVVLGLEGDIGLMDLDGSDKLDLWDGHVWKNQFGGLWGTLRGRLGYAFDRTLIYGTGGVAMMETDEMILGDGDAEQNTYNEGVHTGWVLGGGIEYALTDRITTKLEYLHMEFPEYRGYTNNEESYGFKNDVDLVRVGLNYKF